MVAGQKARATAPIEVAAFVGAGSRAWLAAVFAAYRAGRVVASLPAAAPAAVPGLAFDAVRRFGPDPGWFDETLAPLRSDAPAQVSFSSGTTGAPKALLLSHRALADVVVRINAAMQLDATVREYVGVPVTFSFGFGRVRAVAAAGGRSFLPAHGFDPAEIARLLNAGEINAVSAVPTLWRVLLADPDAIGTAGARVRWIEIGSQYMAGAEKAALKRLFPNARIVQHYGLTEASRTALLDVSAATGPALDSVGRATGEVEIGIGPDGAIRTRGPHVALGRVTGDGLVPVTGEDGWLVTADRGRLEDGWLHYGGRLDEIVNVGGIKVDPTRFEQRLEARLGRTGAVAVGRLPDPLRGERILVAAGAEAGLEPAALRQAAAAVAAEHGLAGQGAVVCREVAWIPVTATGKVRRGALSALPEVRAGAARAAAAAPAQGAAPGPGASGAPARGDSPRAPLRGDLPRAPVPGDSPRAPLRGDLPRAPVPGDASSASVPVPADAARLQVIWAAALGVATVPVDRNFYDLGGDSLSALTVSLGMQAEGIDPAATRGLFEGRTIAELAAPPAAATAPAAAPAPAAAAPLGLSQAINALHGVRGILALWVVVVHWLPGVLERLPGAPIGLYYAIEPLLRFGTPGFAIVFGLGIGALGIPQY